MNLEYSVLMSVYKKEKPEYLVEAIESMLSQSLTPKQIVIVKDGPLNCELNQALEQYESNPLFTFVTLEKNVGLGNALNEGLNHCVCDIVARMDTDDISRADRCEKQLNFLIQHPDISVVGSEIAEFIVDTEHIVTYKRVNSGPQNIDSAIKFRNQLNHPSVMFRKNHIESVGSYKEWPLNEDYYLWIRMVLGGFKLDNISEPLVYMRVTNDTYLRRGGYKYFLTQKRLFDYMLNHQKLTLIEYVFCIVSRFSVQVLLPNQLRKLIYLKVLRKSK